MVKSSYYGDVTLSNEGYRVNHAEKYVREIRIDDITKTERTCLSQPGM